MLPFVTIAVIILLVAVDQVIKLICLNNLEPIGSISLIKNVLSLTYIENTGAAFGSFHGYTTALSILTALVLLVGLVYLLSGRVRKKIPYFALTAVFAGGIGNLIDRVFRGYVIDYIEPKFVDFAVFNFADILVTCGAIVLIVYLLYQMFADSRKERKEKSNEQH